MKKQLIGLGLLAIAIVLAPSTSSARQKNYSVTIPKVLSYPTTTFTFSSSGLLPRWRSVDAAGVGVQFDNPNWSAHVTEVRWNESGAGTYFKLTCDATSTACMKQTGQSGAYSYVLMPEGAAAPSKGGQYALTWDVRPPGDQIEDIAIVPEPSTLPLLAIGLAVLLFVARKKLIANLG